jgi:hypothetical protein
MLQCIYESQLHGKKPYASQSLLMLAAVLEIGKSNRVSVDVPHSDMRADASVGATLHTTFLRS